MKTDKLFYRLFLSQPSLIHELIPSIPADCDFDYSAPVIKDTEFRLDGLLTPVSDDPNLPLVFLECQMQKDTEFYSRYLAEIFLYLNQYKVQRPWYGLLILQNRNQDLGSDIPYQSLLNSQVKRLYLEDLLPVLDLTPSLALLKLIIVKDSEAVNLAKSVLEMAKTEAEFQKQFQLIQAILKSKFPQLTIEEIIAMFDLKTATISDEPDSYQEFVKIFEKRGKQEGESELVIRLLNRRCGNLPIILENQVRSLSIPQLESLGDALLDFQSLADLENWFQQSIQ
jgi:predicted transposase/invertase (TIGR01784 family)